MKIAIYHNLKAGGALVQLKNLISCIKKENELHIFSPNNELSEVSQIYHRFYKTRQPENLLQYLSHAIFELNRVNKIISKSIEREHFDLILVFPCSVLQSPDVIRFLKHRNLIYFFAERKREFYEKTSYDHYSIKKIIARILRIPILVKDYINCTSAPKIISNSQYSKHILKKTYGKESTVIYPGLKQITPTSKLVKNLNKAIIVGQLSYIKGYDMAIQLLSKAGYKEVTIVGRRTEDFEKIEGFSFSLGVKIVLLETENDNKKDQEYKKHGVFIACQRNEPFGITTLEACYNNNIVFGLNEGGTSEIILHGLNGYLFNKKNIIITSKILSKIRKLERIKITKVNTIDWKSMAKKIILQSK